MNTKEKGFFNLADGLIITVCAVLAVLAIVFYLVPVSETESELPQVDATVQLAFTDEDSLTHIAKGDKVFCGETEIGEIKTVDSSFNMVSINIKLQKAENGYFAEGNPIWINSKFTLETRLREIEGKVKAISVRGEEQ